MTEPRQRFEDVFAAAEIPIRSLAVGAPPIQDGYVGVVERDGTTVFVGACRDMHVDEVSTLAWAATALTTTLVVFPWGTPELRVGMTVDAEFAARYAVLVIHPHAAATYIDWKRPGTEGAFHVGRDRAHATIYAP